MKNIIKLFLCVCVLFTTACASSRFLEFTTEDFDKEDEYDAAIAVEPTQPVGPQIGPVESSEKKVAPKSDGPSKPAVVQTKTQDKKAPPAKPKATKPVKKEAKKIAKKPPKNIMKTKVEKKGRKLPLIEDDEGFDGRRPIKDPFRVGEEVRLGVKYFGVKAGELVMKVLPFKTVNGRKSYHFRVEVVSSKSFSMVYKVDDWAETFVDYETLLPYNYAVHVNHSNEKKQIKSVFDHVNNKIKIWEKKIDKDGNLKKGTSDYTMIPFSQNVISVFYYIRAFQLKAGKTIKFPLVDEDNSMILEAEVIREESIDTPSGKRDAFVVKPKVTIEGKFKPVGDVYLWLSKDDRKQILRVESELKIGTLKFDLISVR